MAKSALPKPSRGVARRSWITRVVVVLSFAYPVALVVITLLLRYWGETWWATSIGLYLPRIGFAAPLPVLLVFTLLYRMRRLAWIHLASALILLFPLMGLVISLPRFAREGAPKVRLLTFNVDSGYFGSEKVFAQIQALSPDIVLLQESNMAAGDLTQALEAEYRSVVTSQEFILASRFPIVEAPEPKASFHRGRQRTPQFRRYLIESPLGPLAIYSLHPGSPRGVFYELRGKRGLSREILSGRVFTGWADADVQKNNGDRAFSVKATAEAASAETCPVIIAGDTNLPGLSQIFAQFLGDYQDGFREVGAGFGYTFPGAHPWMRIDRILASEQLRFVHLEAGCSDVSDHLCVFADLERKEP